jgi:sRNA-binding carbon storage regulator CsrA
VQIQKRRPNDLIRITVPCEDEDVVITVKVLSIDGGYVKLGLTADSSVILGIGKPDIGPPGERT